MIQCIIIDPLYMSPGNASPFRRRKILDRMEAETGEISNIPHHLPISFSSKRMGSVRHRNHTADCRLQGIRRSEQFPLSLHDLKNALIITGHPAQIHRNNYFGLFRNGVFQRIIIHFKAVLLNIDQLQRCPHMADYGGGRRIGIRGGDALIPLPYPQ